MSDIDLGPVQEKLRVEGRRSIRMRYVVGKVRRVLWPFIRSYHFIALEWTRDTLQQVRAEARVSSDMVRGLRAENLASSRQTQEVRNLATGLEHRVGALDGEHWRFVQETDRRFGRVEEKLGAIEETRRLLTDLDRRLTVLESGVMDAGEKARRLTSRIESRLQQLESRADPVLASVAPAPAQYEGQSLAFPLGDAVCINSVFGPLIMKRGDLITNDVLRTGSWDAHLVRWLEAAAARGSVAIDAGAHVGTLSCAMAAHFATVHAFEANRDTFLYLCANAALRPGGRIVPHDIALYSTDTELSLATPAQQEIPIDETQGLEHGFRAVDNIGALTFATRGSGVNVIHAVPLDSFRFDDVGLIKIDCQGADGAVILGAIETIRRCRPIVIFEWEEKLSQPHGIPLDAVRARLNEIDYEIEAIYAHNEKQIDYLATPREAHLSEADRRAAVAAVG